MDPKVADKTFKACAVIIMNRFSHFMKKKNVSKYRISFICFMLESGCSRHKRYFLSIPVRAWEFQYIMTNFNFNLIGKLLCLD